MIKNTVWLIGFLLIATNFSCTVTVKCLIKSEPSGAHVSVDDEYKGDTPCEVEWEEWKDHSIEVSKSGYITEIKKVKWHVKQLYFVLQPATPDKTEVSTPQQQEQQMQQQMMGPTIVIGGQTVSGQQAVEIKEYGFVSFQSIPSGAEVYIEGNMIGNAPISRLKFQSGTYNVTVKLKEYTPWTRQILVISNSEINIKAELEKD